MQHCLARSCLCRWGPVSPAHRRKLVPRRTTEARARGDGRRAECAEEARDRCLQPARTLIACRSGEPARQHSGCSESGATVTICRTLATGTTTGYVATNSTAGTKTNTPLIETPQSISVVTRKGAHDRNVQTLKDAVNTRLA